MCGAEVHMLHYQPTRQHCNHCGNRDKTVYGVTTTLFIGFEAYSAGENVCLVLYIKSKPIDREITSPRKENLLMFSKIIELLKSLLKILIGL